MCSDDEDDDEDRGAGDMYADFFSDGGRGDAAQDSEEDEEGPAPKAERRKGARRQAVAEDRDDEQDDDGVEEDGWDGEQLFDTGEGREGGLSRQAAVSAGLQTSLTVKLTRGTQPVMGHSVVRVCMSAAVCCDLQIAGLPREE